MNVKCIYYYYYYYCIRLLICARALYSFFHFSSVAIVLIKKEKKKKEMMMMKMKKKNIPFRICMIIFYSLSFSLSFSLSCLCSLQHIIYIEMGAVVAEWSGASCHSMGRLRFESWRWLDFFKKEFISIFRDISKKKSEKIDSGYGYTYPGLADGNEKMTYTIQKIGMMII